MSQLPYVRTWCMNEFCMLAFHVCINATSCVSRINKRFLRYMRSTAQSKITLLFVSSLLFFFS